jgi:hypothetical protein
MLATLQSDYRAVINFKQWLVLFLGRLFHPIIIPEENV